MRNCTDPERQTGRMCADAAIWSWHGCGANLRGKRGGRPRRSSPLDSQSSGPVRTHRHTRRDQLPSPFRQAVRPSRRRKGHTHVARRTMAVLGRACALAICADIASNWLKYKMVALNCYGSLWHISHGVNFCSDPALCWCRLRLEQLSSTTLPGSAWWSRSYTAPVVNTCSSISATQQFPRLCPGVEIKAAHEVQRIFARHERIGRRIDPIIGSRQREAQRSASAQRGECRPLLAA